MDSTALSAAAVARQLGTSLPRVVRAIERLGLDARQANGRMQLDDSQVDQLRAELGVSVRVPGLTPAQVSVLLALRDAPLGLLSVRALARRAALSPTASGRAFRTLETAGLAAREPTTIAAGSARAVQLLQLNRRAPRWARIAPLLAPAQLPARPELPTERHVPRALGHLFWNTAPSQLTLPGGGPYLARRLLRTMDLEGLAWGARTLKSSDWREGARARGLDPAVRSLARNLASAAER